MHRRFPRTAGKITDLSGKSINSEKKEFPMDFMTAVRKRSSYRGKYDLSPIGRGDLKQIMEAGLAAPSGCNKQTTEIIAVDDAIVLDELYALIDPPVIKRAPAMICVLTKKIIAYRGRSFQVQDYSAAIENMLLTIVALGYESCWVEGHITDADRIGDKMAGLLGVPAGVELVCVLPVGRALDPVTRIEKKAFEERAWFNRYKTGD